MIGAERLLPLLHDALHGQQTDGLEIAVEGIRQGVTRFAGSRIHQTTELQTARVHVRAIIGGSIGRAVGDRLSPEDLRQLVADAIAVAHLVPPNRHWVSLPGPEPVHPVAGFDQGTADLTPGDRADAIETIVNAVAERGWTVAGTYLSEVRELAVVNSLGVSSYAPSTMAFLRALPESGVGTGYADALSHRAADLDPGAVAQRAMMKCAANHDQQELPPGEYEAVFEDLCVAEALTAFGTRSFSAESYQQGNSFVSDRLGEQVTGGNVSIWDDGTDATGLAVATDWEGIPKRRVPLIEHGVASGVCYDSYTAHRVGLQSTGNASDPAWSYLGPTPANLFMAGGNASVAEMIAATERGLLVTRFHYTHVPDRKRAVLTGTTRDGTFLIERGEITGAVRNLRLTQSVPDLFSGIELLGTPRLCRDWWSSNGMGRIACVCPPIKVRRAIFTGGALH